MAETSMKVDVSTFEINSEKWTIMEVPNIGDEITTLGETEYFHRIIRLVDWVDTSTKMRTLKHELTHVWLWEYGHNQHREDKVFTSEDICEIVACSNDFINEVIEKYFKGGK